VLSLILLPPFHVFLNINYDYHVIELLVELTDSWAQLRASLPKVLCPRRQRHQCGVHRISKSIRSDRVYHPSDINMAHSMLPKQPKGQADGSSDKTSNTEKFSTKTFKQKVRQIKIEKGLPVSDEEEEVPPTLGDGRHAREVHRNLTNPH